MSGNFPSDEVGKSYTCLNVQKAGLDMLTPIRVFLAFSRNRLMYQITAIFPYMNPLYA